MIVAKGLHAFNGGSRNVFCPTRNIVCSSSSTKDDGIMAVPERIGGILVDFEPMSPEEMQRTMQFVLRQQGQFAADFERLSAKTDRMADAIIGLTGIVGHLHEAQ